MSDRFSVDYIDDALLEWETAKQEHGIDDDIISTGFDVLREAGAIK